MGADARSRALHYGVVDRLVWLLDGRGGLGLLEAGWSGEAGLTLGSGAPNAPAARKATFLPRDAMTPQPGQPGSWLVSMITCRRPAITAVEMTR